MRLRNRWNTCVFMVDIGELIHEKVAEKGLSVTWLANRLNCSRTNVYKIFDRRTIDTGTLLRISTVLEFDFFEIYSRELHIRLLSLSDCK